MTASSENLNDQDTHSTKNVVVEKHSSGQIYFEKEPTFPDNFL